MTEIGLTRLPGRPNDVGLHTDSAHPHMLVVIGFAGLKHGDVFGFDAVNREKMRAWLDKQDAEPPPTLAGMVNMLARAIDAASLPELHHAREALSRISTNMAEPASLRVIAKNMRNSIATK